jgi:hypothetical protein
MIERALSELLSRHGDPQAFKTMYATVVLLKTVQRPLCPAGEKGERQLLFSYLTDCKLEGLHWYCHSDKSHRLCCRSISKNSAVFSAAAHSVISLPLRLLLCRPTTHRPTAPPLVLPRILPAHPQLIPCPFTTFPKSTPLLPHQAVVT